MKVYIDDNEYSASEGETIIQVADRNNIHIPRFCYHKHLSVVASCRMCLVEIDKAKQAQPACSTLVYEDMHVNTKSQKTLLNLTAFYTIYVFFTTIELWTAKHAKIMPLHVGTGRERISF